ncbi:MAG: hypothetical protein JWO99_244 [Candidatus Saccharibacteria bacterium]|nr:hypothetical protein [Candidatus Saccharibacteria bacterium]
MKTKVIIPAYNEGRHLERTLNSLPNDLVEPIVAINGSSDNTLEIAEKFGAEVHVTAEQGKMLAIQHVLHSLGEQALDPLIILDADTRPLFPTRWHNGIVKLLRQQERPAVIGGPIWYTGKPLGETVLRTAYRAARTALHKNDTGAKHAVQFGPNMALKIQNTDLLEIVMNIPNFWPGEDRALTHAVLDQDGVYHTPINVGLVTTTPRSISSISLKDRLQLGAEASFNEVEQRYTLRGNPSSEPYRDPS